MVRLHFHENQALALETDDVDLRVSTMVVALEDLESSTSEEAHCDTLTPTAAGQLCTNGEKIRKETADHSPTSIALDVKAVPNTEEKKKTREAPKTRGRLRRKTDNSTELFARQFLPLLARGRFASKI